MKKLIAELPTLTAPMEKEDMIVYLAAACEAISAVLMTEKVAKQMPVYFVSRALQGPEINYTPLEKLVPRSENKKANALSKIASTSFAHLTKWVLEEELNEKSINEAEVLAVYARRNKICGSKSQTDMILLANNACGCKKDDSGMSRLLGITHLKIGVKSYASVGALPPSSIHKPMIKEVPHVLWAHCTMIKSSNGDTLFLLTYVLEAVIPAEIGMPTLRTTEINMVRNDEALEINLDLLEEIREQVAIREA
ncbi:reverse transcriptase domain-containing protein [Tanacetum coccineum]